MLNLPFERIWEAGKYTLNGILDILKQSIFGLMFEATIVGFARNKVSWWIEKFLQENEKKMKETIKKF